jgi:hypothetical protein
MFWSGSFLLAIGESHNQRQKVQSEPVSVADLTAFLDIIFQKQFIQVSFRFMQRPSHPNL